MTRHRFGALLVASLVVLASCWGSALARPSTHRAGAQASFTHWTVHASGGGASVSQKVRPGGTFRICSSSKLTRLDAHYRSSFPSGTSVHTVWKPPGQSAQSQPGKIGSKGYFYIANQQDGLPLGKWQLKIVRHSRTIASSFVTIASEHC